MTSISADTHKYGYALKGTSTVLFRDRALRNAAYFFLPDWSGGKYFSPGNGRLALRRAARRDMVGNGRDGARGLPPPCRADLRHLRGDAGRGASHAELRLLGGPTFLFAFTSDDFDIYHVNDRMKERGWRFNGLQYPNALHMAVTRPQTQPGVAEAFAADLADAVAYAREHAGEPAASAAIYGGVPGGHDARGRRASSHGHGADPRRAAGRPSREDAGGRSPEPSTPSPSTWARAAPRSGWCRSRGERPGGSTSRCRRAARPAARREQDAQEWWDLIAGAARRGLAGGASPPTASSPSPSPGSGRARVPVDERGLPVGALRHVAGRARPRPQSRAHRRARWPGSTPSARADLGPPQRRRPVARRRGPDQPPASSSSATGPRSARAARWYLEPVDYLAMRFTGRAAASPASMTAAWLTDNRRLDRLRRTTPRSCAWRHRRGEAAAAGADRLGDRTGARRRRRRSRAARGRAGRHRDARPARGGRRLAARSASTATHMAISTTGWISCPLRARRPTSATRWPACRGSAWPLPPREQPSTPPASASSGARAQVFDAEPPATYEDVLALAASAAPGSGGVVFTPWLAGKRSPVERPPARGGWHNLSLATTRSQLVRAVLEGVACNARWLHDAVERFAGDAPGPDPHRRRRRAVGPVVPDRRRRSRAADRTGGGPADAVLRGATLLAGAGLGAIALDDVRDWSRSIGSSSPDPATRETYDRLYSEFPGLYKAQRKMFARLNG